jgi:hypothetical protein
MSSISKMACLAAGIALALSACTGTSGGVSDYGRGSDAPSGSAPSTTVPAPVSSSSAPETSEPAAWTTATLWDTCQAAWTKREPGIDWAKFDAYDPQASGTDLSRDAIYVARYRTRTTPYDVRDCLITGTPADYKIMLHPALDTD